MKKGNNESKIEGQYSFSPDRGELSKRVVKEKEVNQAVVSYIYFFFVCLFACLFILIYNIFLLDSIRY